MLDTENNGLEYFSSEHPQKGIAIYLHSLTQGPDSEFAQSIVRGLVEDGYGVWTFSFDFFINKSKPSSGLKEECDLLDQVISFLDEKNSGQNLTLIGKSLGGSIALAYAASRKTDRVKEIVVLGLPLALGFPPRVDLLKGAESEPFDAVEEYQNLLQSVDCDVRVIQGDADDLGPVKDCQNALSIKQNATMSVIAGADHSFMVKGASAMNQVLASLKKN